MGEDSAKYDPENRRSFSENSKPKSIENKSVCAARSDARLINIQRAGHVDISPTMNLMHELKVGRNTARRNTHLLTRHENKNTRAAKEDHHQSIAIRLITEKEGNVSKIHQHA